MNKDELFNRLCMIDVQEKQNVVGMKPCPWCGCEMDLVKVVMCDNKTVRYDPVPKKGIHKRGCQLEFSGSAFIGQPTTVKGALNKWNRFSI